MLRNIKYIIVHCAATPEGKDFTVADIDKWHRERGFSRIGYHYVVYRDGSIHKGRSEDVEGAHTMGYNKYSIGICYIGGLSSDGSTPKDTRTDAQKEGLIKLLKDLRTRYPLAKICGHRDFTDKKACPCFDAAEEYKNL